jgi:hypothetical protein
MAAMEGRKEGREGREGRSDGWLPLKEEGRKEGWKEGRKEGRKEGWRMEAVPARTAQCEAAICMLIVNSHCSPQEPRIQVVPGSFERPFQGLQDGSKTTKIWQLPGEIQGLQVRARVRALQHHAGSVRKEGRRKDGGRKEGGRKEGAVGWNP